jgi:DNA-binding transcriptional regulator YdaS (Cro superfamily)/post-segregation antitoxin (ccd killing protein)
MVASQDRQAGLDRALAAAGGTTALTAALGLSKSVVGNWRRTGGIPAGRVPAVARLTGLPPEALRPDLFSPAAPPGLAEAQVPLAAEAAAFHPLAAEAAALHPLAAEAAALGNDAAKVAADAVRAAIGAARARAWAAENREAIEAWTRHFAEHDTPLAAYRMF